jgi:hypothetical protein
MRYVGDRDSWRDFLDESLLVSLEIKPRLTARPSKCKFVRAAIGRAMRQPGRPPLLVVSGSPWQWQPCWTLWTGGRLYRAAEPNVDAETPREYVRRLWGG